MPVHVTDRSLCVLAVALAVAAGGCMVGPDYERPQVIEEPASDYVQAFDKPAEVEPNLSVGPWWRRFEDPATVALVERALEHNHDLRAGAARVLQARAALGQARGALWPAVSYDLSRDRSKRSFNLGGGVGGGDPNQPSPSGGRFSVLSTTWSQAISVSYLVDFWGQLRHAEQAALTDLLAADASQQALVHSIIATVINARVEVATLMRRLAIAEANVESRRQILEITERRYEQGLVGPVDVRLARTNLEASNAQVPAIALSLARARHSLAVLAGRRPGPWLDVPAALPDVPGAEVVDVGVPAALLDRRPDVVAADLSLRAANERIGVSIAQLYPNLVLTANFGYTGDRWEDIWQSYTETYSALINLAQPIFEGGRLRAQVAAAKARYAELAANYAGTVLTAIREVEDALAAERLLRRQIESVRLQLREAEASEDLARQRYQRGVESILTVLETERSRLAAEEQVAVLQGQIWTARVNLHLALGGDWVEDGIREE